MFKKMHENVQKIRDDVHETSPKNGSTKTCKNMAKIALNMDNVYLDVAVLTSPCWVVVIPMSRSQHAHVCQLTSPCFLQRPVHPDVLLHFFFPNVDVQQNIYDFWRHHKKTRVSYSDVMCSPIYSYAPATTPPYYNELPSKIMWWGEHLGLVKHKNAIEGWEGWTFYPNDDMVTRPPIAIVENQCPPMQ